MQQYRRCAIDARLLSVIAVCGFAVGCSGGSGEPEASPASSNANTIGAGSDTQPPTTPAGVIANATSAHEISLSWQPSTDNVGVTSYVVYRADVQIARVVGTSHVDSELEPNARYCYSVVASDAAGNESPHSEESCATTTAVDDTPIYEIVAIGDGTDEAFTLLNDLNENGTVVGEIVRALNPQDEYSRQGSFAFAWRDGRLEDLGAFDPLVRDSRSQGINDAEEIVGWSYPGPDAQPAFVWRNGHMKPIGLADAYGINDAGQVVGYLHRTQGAEAFGVAVVWQAGHITELTELANPWNINDAGDVVGFSYVDARPQASLYRAGAVTLLGTLPGSPTSQAFDINEAGQVIGTSHFLPTDGSESYDRAFLWESGQMRELKPLSANDRAASAYGLNDRGDVVGRSGTSRFVAVIWIDDVAHDLNSLISEDDPLRPFVRLLEAREINNRGQIIAQGTDSRRPGSYTGYLLNPR